MTTYEKTINDMQISLTTDGYPPAVRIHRPSRVGQPDIVMTIAEAGEFISALSEMMGEAMGRTK